ncbi:MAG: RecX family transcriptional regulator [Acidobacteriota bacterium]|nr:RecX family transcriptional regulator [Acidobacteriota bacterium]
MAFARPQKKDPLNEEQLLEYAVGALARRMRTVRDLKRLMRTRVEPGEPGEQLMDAVCARLKELGYLSDKRFAADYTRVRVEHEKLGRRRVQQALAQKGIHKDLIATTLTAAYEGVDELALVRAYIAKKRLQQPTGADAQKQTTRLVGRLMRAGFSSRTVFKVLREWDLPLDVDALEGGADSDSYAEPDE